MRVIVPLERTMSSPKPDHSLSSGADCCRAQSSRWNRFDPEAHLRGDASMDRRIVQPESLSHPYGIDVIRPFNRRSETRTDQRR